MCENVLFLVVFKIINTIIKIVQVALPFIIIVMGTIDLVKVATKGTQEEFTATAKSLVYRFVAAVMIFFLPIVIPAFMKVLITDIDEYNIDCAFNIDNEKVIIAKTKNAAGAIEYAENNLNYSNYNLAKRLVSRMDSSSEKDALQKRLDELKEQLELMEKEENETRIKKAKEIAEQRKKQAASASTGNSNLEGSGEITLTGTDQEIINSIQSRYNSLVSSNGDYTHKCGKLVCDQLQYSGLINDSDRVMNGYEQAEAIARGNLTGTGHKAIGYSVTRETAVSTFESIIKGNNGELENLVISFSPYSGGGLGQYGHVCLISKIRNNKVYLVDNTSFTKNSSGAYSATVMSVQDFEAKYFGSFGARYMTHVL